MKQQALEQQSIYREQNFIPVMQKRIKLKINRPRLFSLHQQKLPDQLFTYLNGELKT